MTSLSPTFQRPLTGAIDGSPSTMGVSAGSALRPRAVRAPRVLPSALETARLAIVVPAYNAADEIGDVLRAIAAGAARLPGTATLCYPVDDGSTDATYEMILAVGVGAELPLKPIRLPENQGLTAALSYAYAHVLRDQSFGATHILTLDADLTIAPDEAVARMAAPIPTGASLVTGIWPHPVAPPVPLAPEILAEVAALTAAWRELRMPGTDPRAVRATLIEARTLGWLLGDPSVETYALRWGFAALLAAVARVERLPVVAVSLTDGEAPIDGDVSAPEEAAVPPDRSPDAVAAKLRSQVESYREVVARVGQRGPAQLSFFD